MTHRKQISKRLRFEVFKRDRFTCQYCGKQSPDVVLHVDHIKPVSLGGKNTITNLITACQDCNLGKSNIQLSDDAAVKRQLNQMQMLAERDEQISMMVEWQEAIINSEEKLVASAENRINEILGGMQTVNENGRLSIRRAIKKNGYEKVMNAIELACENSTSIDHFSKSCWKYMSFIDKQTEEKAAIAYILGIVRNRLGVTPKEFYAKVGNLEPSLEEIERIKEMAKGCVSKQEFYSHYEGIVYGEI